MIVHGISSAKYGKDCPMYQHPAAQDRRQSRSPLFHRAQEHPGALQLSNAPPGRPGHQPLFQGQGTAVCRKSLVQQQSALLLAGEQRRHQTVPTGRQATGAAEMATGPGCLRGGDEHVQVGQCPPVQISGIRLLEDRRCP